MATIGELFVKLGINQDKASFKKAENNVRKIGSFAQKTLAKIGIVLSAKKLISILKNTENIKNATTEVKETWTNVFKELDDTYGVTKIIAKWIKTASNYLLSLFRKLEPMLRSVVKSLGGTETVLKNILLIATNISAVKMFKNMFPNTSSLKIKAIVGLLTFLYLIIEDIYGFLNGKKSFLGYILKKYNIDIDKVIGNIGKMKQILLDIGKAILGVFTGENTNAISTFQDLIASVFEAFYKWFTDEENMNRFISGLESIKTTVEKIVGFVQGIDISQWKTGIKGALAAFAGFKALKAGKSVVDFFGSFKKAKGAEKSVSTLGKVFKKLGESNALGKLKSGLGKGIKGLGKGIGKGFSKLPGLFSKIGAGAKAAFGVIGIKGILIIAAIAAIIAIVILLIKNWDKIKEKAKEIAAKVKEKFTEIKDGIKERLSAIKDAAKEKLDRVKEAFRNAFQSIKDFVKNHIVLIIGIITGPVGALVAYIIKHRDEIKEKLSNLKDKIVEIINGIKDKYNEHIKPIFDWIKGKIDELEQKIANSKFGKWIAEKFGIDLSDSEESVEKSKDNIESTMTDMADGATDSGFDYSKNLAAGIRAGLPEIRSATDEVAAAIAEKTHFSVPDKGPLKDQDKWGGDYISNLVNGIRNSMPRLRSAVSQVATSLGIGNGVTANLQRAINLVAGASSTTVINMSNNWTNNFGGDQSSAFARAITAQEDQVGTTLGRRLSYTR